MLVQFGENLSDSRFVKKEFTFIEEKEILLLEDDNIVNPVIVVAIFKDFGIPNYAFISNFKRYYYITGYEVLTGSRVKYSLKCDVLMSFAKDIKASTAILSRSNTAGNILMNDNLQGMRTDEILTNLAFSGCEFLKGGVSAANYSFLLNTFGGENSGV